MSSEHREFPRLNANVYCRPSRLDRVKRNVQNISHGGVRVYSDVSYRLGEILNLELFQEDGNIVEFTAKVIWILPLEDSMDASYDVGLEFCKISTEAKQLLDSLSQSE